MSQTRSLTRRLLGSDVVASLTSPHGVDRYLEIVNPMWAVNEVRARVVRVERETYVGPPVVTITLQPTSTWTGFTAGQHVQLGVEIAGARRTTRAFSISSGESAAGTPFTITLRANPDGLVSRFLAEQARPGQLVHLSQAEGEFVLPTPLPERLLLVSGGSGITPVMSMLRTLLARGYDGRVTFVHYAQSPEHQIFAEELGFVARMANVDVHLVHGDLFTAEMLASYVPDFADVETWACGPGAMIALVQEAYDGSDRLLVEYFKTPADSLGNAEGDVTFSRTGEGAANSGKTLLEQAEDLGLTPEYGCRMGICFTCTRTKVEGTVRNVISGAESSLPDEEIQICVNAPVGDCVVDL
ncbi:MAG: ferredoxin reductase [Nocardioidaceae bacterium]|nr:ferredoxin reductase [Nocardioidaceae bacterium]